MHKKNPKNKKGGEKTPQLKKIKERTGLAKKNPTQPNLWLKEFAAACGTWVTLSAVGRRKKRESSREKRDVSN